MYNVAFVEDDKCVAQKGCRLCIMYCPEADCIKLDTRKMKAYVVVEAQGKAQPLPAWRALWGKPGDRQPHVLELPWSPKTPFNLEQPRLERLALPREIRARFSGEVPGADMVGLGILKKLPPP